MIIFLIPLNVSALTDETLQEWLMETSGSELVKIEYENQPHASALLLRVEPLKWWLYGTTLADLSPDAGCLLDLSHARTHVRVSGPDAATCLNRHLPVDLRHGTCPVGSVVSTALHHVAVTLWRSEHGFELFLPRGFALSCWEVLMETAEQFGVEVV